MEKDELYKKRDELCQKKTSSTNRRTNAARWKTTARKRERTTQGCVNVVPRVQWTASLLRRGEKRVAYCIAGVYCKRFSFNYCASGGGGGAGDCSSSPVPAPVPFLLTSANGSSLFAWLYRDSTDPAKHVPPGKTTHTLHDTT